MSIIQQPKVELVQNSETGSNLSANETESAQEEADSGNTDSDSDSLEEIFQYNFDSLLDEYDKGYDWNKWIQKWQTINIISCIDNLDNLDNHDETDEKYEKSETIIHTSDTFETIQDILIDINFEFDKIFHRDGGTFLDLYNQDSKSDSELIASCTANGFDIIKPSPEPFDPSTLFDL